MIAPLREPVDGYLQCSAIPPLECASICQRDQAPVIPALGDADSLSRTANFPGLKLPHSECSELTPAYARNLIYSINGISHSPWAISLYTR